MSGLEPAAALVAAAVKAAIQAGAPRRTIAAMTAAAVSAALPSPAPSKSAATASASAPAEPVSRLVDQLRDIRRVERNRKRRQRRKKAKGKPEVVEIDEWLNLPVSRQQSRRESEGEVAEEEEAAPAVTSHSPAAAAAEEDEEFVRQDLLVQKRIGVFETRRKEIKELQTETAKRRAVMNFLKECPLVWAKYGFNSKEEFDKAHQEAEAACEPEKKEKRDSVPPGAKRKGKRLSNR